MTAETEAALIDSIAAFRHDPRGYVDFSYPWQEPGPLAEAPGPRTWQAAVLDDLGAHLQNPATRCQPYLGAIASGHGIGKSAFVSWILDWGLSTCVDAVAVVTANTDTQLATKTWPELGRWRNLSITSHWFRYEATSLASRDPKHRKVWRADAIPWTEHRSEAFAGLHNQGRRVILIFDEASAIADKIWEVAEGALTDQDTEIIWLAFGNPTRNTGRFRECFGRLRHRWHTWQIDSRTVDGTNKEQLDKWVADYGEDSDFVKVRVRGMFPSASAKQFISVADVDAAYGRYLRPEQYEWAPKILTCDPAWSGDDELVIGLRQGLRFQILRAIPKNDNDVQIGTLVANLEDEHQADAVFIDGGYGTGIVSVGRTLGRHWQLVWFGEAASDMGCLNKRAEMWKLGRDWLKEGGAIPEDTVLHDDLIGPETVPRLDGKLVIEPKEAMKKRGLPSPNRGDALMLSFAYPVATHRGDRSAEPHKCVTEWDPFR